MEDRCHGTGQGEVLQWEASLARIQGRVQEGLEGSVWTTARDSVLARYFGFQETVPPGYHHRGWGAALAALASASAQPPHPRQPQLPLSTAPPSCLMCLVRPLLAEGLEACTGPAS